MSAELCHRESDLLDALGRGYIGAELEEHVATCSSCSELRLVAGALLDERAEAIVEAPIPSSGAMWYRMRVRARHEAQTQARRSLLLGQAATVAIAMLLVFSFFGADVAFAVRDLVATIRLSTPLLLALATWILLAPLAGWVAIRQK
jgi:predicted anti-sigma-YlaC factor YlaD